MSFPKYVADESAGLILVSLEKGKLRKHPAPHVLQAHIIIIIPPSGNTPGGY